MSLDEARIPGRRPGSINDSEVGLVLRKAMRSLRKPETNPWRRKLRGIASSSNRRASQMCDGGTITMQELCDLLVAQQYRCQLSGEQLTPENVQADHIVPISRGGVHAIDNVQLVTARINQAKGTLSQDEFVEMCCSVAQHQGFASCW